MSKFEIKAVITSIETISKDEQIKVTLQGLENYCAKRGDEEFNLLWLCKEPKPIYTTQEFYISNIMLPLLSELYTNKTPAFFAVDEEENKKYIITKISNQ